MKEEWLFPNAVVPVNVETTAALVAEIHRLIDVAGGMALAQRTWVGLTDEEINACDPSEECWGLHEIARAIEARLKEKNT